MKFMRLHILQHVPFENPGTILDWADERGFPVSFTRFYLHETLPEPDDFDLLIVMGGPMSLSDTEKYPWLVKEKIFLKKTLALGKKMVGICLGAQLLAEILGANVYPNAEKEIGWFPIRKNPAANHKILKLFNEETLPAFHWHGDTFDLPEGAIPLFSSEATLNQAFVWKERVFALQFHWEVKPENVRLLLENAATDLTDGGTFVQNAKEMIADNELFAQSRNNLFRFLDFVTIS
jgi:GMP synthase-like glutamine amidotransferase